MTMQAALNDTVVAGGLAPAASLFHGLSDPTRLTILQHLTLGEHRVRDLTEHLGLAQSTVSAHLACLRDCGLVTSRPVGRASMFSLATQPELLDVLRAAEALLAATGYAVTLCPNYGISGGEAPGAEPVAHPSTAEASAG
jgi:DNA-binding transcriptional ArsR family regulator